MDWVMQRCNTYRQTETGSSIAAEWAVQLNNLPGDCTALYITGLLNGNIGFFLMWFNKAIRL